MDWKFKGLQLISSLMSVCIFSTIFQMLVIEVEMSFRVKVHCSCIYAWTHMLRSFCSWETTGRQCGALLGTHITINFKANVQQPSSLPVFSSSDGHTCLVEELCEIVLFTNSHNDIVSWLMAAQPHPQCPLNNKRLLTKASERAKQK